MWGTQNIVIDDDPKHLIGLTDVLSRHGLSCRQILFDGNIERVDACPDVRHIFADLHLGAGAINSDHQTDFSTIGSLLQFAIRPASRYAIVLWTMYPDQAPRLEAFLSERLTDVESPVCVHPLPKSIYLDDADRVWDETKLLDELQKAIKDADIFIDKPDPSSMRDTLRQLFECPEAGTRAVLVAKVPGLDVSLDDWMNRDLQGIGMTPSAILEGDDARKLFMLQRVVNSIATRRAASHPSVVRDVVRGRIEGLYRSGTSLDLIEGPDVGEERTASGWEHWMETANPLFGDCSPREFFEAEKVDVQRLAGISARLDAVDEGTFS